MGVFCPGIWRCGTMSLRWIAPLVHPSQCCTLTYRLREGFTPPGRNDVDATKGFDARKLMRNVSREVATMFFFSSLFYLPQIWWWYFGNFCYIPSTIPGPRLVPLPSGTPYHVATFSTLEKSLGVEQLPGPLDFGVTFRYGSNEKAGNRSAVLASLGVVIHALREWCYWCLKRGFGQWCKNKTLWMHQSLRTKV